MDPETARLWVQVGRLIERLPGPVVLAVIFWSGFPTRMVDLLIAMHESGGMSQMGAALGVIAGAALIVAMIRRLVLKLNEANARVAQLEDENRRLWNGLRGQPSLPFNQEAP